MTLKRCGQHAQHNDTCEECLAERDYWLTLEDELDEMAAADPEVRAAHEQYRRTVREMLRQQKPVDPQGPARPAWHAPRDDDP